MGRTIPSFRIAVVLEEKEWKQYRKYLNNKKDRKAFDNMFSIAYLYNSASSNAVIPIRIQPIMMSIILHHYMMLKERTSSFVGFDNSFDDLDNNIYSTILKQEIDKWNNYSFVLRKQNRDLFQEMLQSSYKYSGGINAKGKEFVTESLLISLIFNQHKMLLLMNAIANNNKLDCYL